MSTRLLGRPTGTSPIVSARHSSFPRAWSPNEARWEPRRGVIPELLLDRTAFWGRQQSASLDKTLIARGHRSPGAPEEPMPQNLSTSMRHGVREFTVAGSAHSSAPHGKGEGEGRALAHLAFHPDSPAM